MTTYIGYSSVGSLVGSRTLTDVEIAKRDLLNHFYTKRGERVMNPEFGSILHELVFEPLYETTMSLALDDVKRIIENDPRWIEIETLLEKPQEHTLEIYVRLRYDETGTAEELFLKFEGEIA